jgi:site-specific DNA-methyltransferase (adenine-specific)
MPTPTTDKSPAVPTPYYEDERVTIFHGDFAELARDGAITEAAAVIGSPPYNVGVDYDDSDDNLDPVDYLTDVHRWCDATADVLKLANGRAFINVAPVVAMANGDRLPLSFLWSKALDLSGMWLRDTIAWCSARGAGTAWGSYEQPSAPNLRGDHEHIIVAHAGADWARTPPDGMTGWKDSEGNWPKLVSNVWAIRPEHSSASQHPVPFPLEIPSRCIRLSTWPGETVLDPWMGSGTTLRAAVNLGRKAIGCDVSERYCEMTAERLSQGTLL